MLIDFTREQIMPVIEAAERRQDFAEENDLRNYGYARNLPLDRIRDNHRIGAVGEWVCATAFHLKFDPSIGKIDTVDLKIIEVRARRIEPIRPMPDLTIRPIDKMRLPHVLVRVDMANLIAEIPGWLCAWEAKERPDKVWFEAGEVWFVPPPYHTPVSLQQWIERGHPLHYAPEKYR